MTKKVDLSYKGIEFVNDCVFFLAKNTEVVDEQPDNEVVETAPDTTEEVEAEPAVVSELTDGKFAETRHITVEIYDRGNDGGSDPTNNMYTDYIKKGMLEDHNVEVEFVAVPRWTEVEELNNLLAEEYAPNELKSRYY